MATALSRPASLDEGQVLGEALGHIAGFWQLTNEQLGRSLGLSPASASRLRAGSYAIQRGDKAFELGQFLLRLFRSLDALVGSDDAAARSWLRTPSLELDARPIDLLPTVAGLVRLCDHVDAYRARV